MNKMNSKELFEKIIHDVSFTDFFTDFKFRKRDSCFFSQENGMRKELALNHWVDTSTGELVIYPGFTIRFDILLNWFCKYSFKTKQDQKDNYSFGIESSMLGCKSSYYRFNLKEGNYKSDFKTFINDVLRCAKWMFTNYATLKSAYQNEIEPVLKGEKELPDIGIDWAFIDLTLCRVVAPQNYSKFKEIVMTRIEFLHSREEPNLAFYYDRLDEIIGYMEGLTIEELKSCKI